MVTILIDKFNSYIDGALDGQGGWTGDENFIVQGEIVSEGLKAVKFSAQGIIGEIYKTGDSIANGSFACNIRKDTNKMDGEQLVQLLDEDYLEVACIGLVGNDIKYYSNGSYYTLLSNYSLATWYNVEIEWRSSDYKVRYRINKGTWTSWVERGQLGVLNPMQVALYVDNFTGEGIAYFDCITTEHYHIYRGQDGAIDYENIQGEMAIGVASIALSSQALPAGTIWQYVRRQVSECGLESEDSPLCQVVIDADGDMVPLCPNEPMDLTIEPAAGGKFKLRWRYIAINQELTPTGFKIYQVDDEWVLLDTITRMIGNYDEFEWTSGAYSDGERHHFGVHSYSDAGGESQNTDIVSATANAEGPSVITGLEAVVVEV